MSRSYEARAPRRKRACGAPDLFRLAGTGLLALFAASCAGGPEPFPTTPRAPTPSVPAPPQADVRGPERDPRGAVTPVTPPHLADNDALVRVGLLLPFSARSAGARGEAAGMLDAAQLAIFELQADHIVLLPKDTAGTPDGARAAARAALNEGADVILGPLFGEAVQPVVDEARAYAAQVVAFSNDRSAAGRGAFLLGRAPEDEIRRIVAYAAQRLAAEKAADPDFGAAPDPFTAAPPPATFDPYSYQPGPQAGGDPTLTQPPGFGADPFAPLVRFAAFVSDDAYGRRVLAALQTAAEEFGAAVTAYEYFPASGDAEALTVPARRLARYDERLVWNASNAEALVTPRINDPLAEPPPEFELPYDAVLLPEGGLRLRSIAPLLPFYDVDPRKTRFIGTSLWNDETVAREPALDGGWFAAPDPDADSLFANRFRAATGAAPGRLSGLAYDGIALVAELTEIQGGFGLRPDAFARPDGFQGVGGVYRFRPDGAAERAFAVMEVRRGGFRVLEPAPTSFPPAVF